MISLDALAALVPGARIHGDGTTDVSELAYDSRAVPRGALFFCIPGARADGHAFAGAALEAGATALVVERTLDVDAPQVLVPSVRAAMGPIAASFFGEPARAMSVVGVTGTNGKTTTTYMLEAAMQGRGRVSGVIGTVSTRIGDAVEPVKHTTPESIDLHRMLARMRTAGVDEVAIEVSSHGLAWGRVAGTRFACVAFTNLSQDHLDDHGSMEAYYEAKASLFTPSYASIAAINVGDEAGRRIAGSTELDVVTYATDADADVRALDIAFDPTGARASVDARGAGLEVRVPLSGRHNVENALGVLAVGVALGWDLEEVTAALARMDGVPGRLERIDEGQPFTVLVDYAHTPDALENVLRAVRPLVGDGARLVCVFGCGGDRDRTKRPLMGRVASELADHVIVTSDNPRMEDPASIVEQIVAGAGRPVAAIVDRAEAIGTAVTEAGPGDVVVIAGKGHETGQTFADRVIEFDDRVVAREALRSL